ncbi:3890_t:CDS:2, partial [Gigaspora margarita]
QQHVRTFTRALMTINLNGSPLKSILQQLQIAATTNTLILMERTSKLTTVLMHLINTIHELEITIEQADSMLKKSFNKAELKWVEQLVDYNIEKMLK